MRIITLPLLLLLLLLLLVLQNLLKGGDNAGKLTQLTALASEQLAGVKGERR